MMKVQQQSLVINSSFSNRRISTNSTAQFRGANYREILPEIVTQEHSWISVINPRNQLSLLQACDDCGIVKSENSMIKNCRATPGLAIISGAVDISEQTVM